MMIHRRKARARFVAGFTLVEVSVCVVITGVMFAAVMQTVGQSSIMQYRLSERSRGAQLARMLMAEIMQQSYADPVGGTGTLGPGPGEVRSTYNDVDDYTNYTESPPTNKDGSAISMPASTTWRRSVTCVWINPATLATSSTESGAKKITVTVYHNGFAVATLSAIRSNAP